MMLIAITFLTVTAAFAQTAEPRLAITDAEKIADALRAGPAFITKGATLLDWPPASGSEYRVLRKGSNEWTCLPVIPGYPHDEPRVLRHGIPALDLGRPGRPDPAH